VGFPLDRYDTAPGEAWKWVNWTRSRGAIVPERHVLARSCQMWHGAAQCFLGRVYFASPRPICVSVTGGAPIRPDSRHARAPRRAVEPRPVPSARAASTHGDGPDALAAFARASCHSRTIADRTAASSCSVGDPATTRTSGGSVIRGCCRACAAPASRASSTASRAHR